VVVRPVPAAAYHLHLQMGEIDLGEEPLLEEFEFHSYMGSDGEASLCLSNDNEHALSLDITFSHGVELHHLAGLADMDDTLYVR
jgi:hypothetical protein